MLSGYSVSEDDEDDNDDDDEGRSKAIPSRTNFGVMSAFGEKHPWALQSKHFLFGFITVQFWEYRCVLTNAQIELMCADIPRIKYTKTALSKTGKAPTKKAIDETIRIWNERKKKEAEEAAKKQTPQ